MFSTKCINSIVNSFYELIYDTIAKNTQKFVVYKHKYPSWFSKQLRHMLYLKRYTHKIYKKSKNNDDYLKFSKLRSQCKILTKSCHNNYLLSTQNNLKKNPRKFWKFIKTNKNITTLPSTLKYENNISNNLFDISNYFGKYFSSILVNNNYSNLNNNNLPETNNINFSNYQFSIKDIFEGLSNIGFNPISGPDLIPPLFLYHCRYSLSYPIMRLFNISLSSGTFPDIWKHS